MSFKQQFRDDGIVKYCKEHSTKLLPTQQSLVDATMKLPMARMLGGIDEAQLFSIILKAMGAKKVLEIGVFTGSTTLFMASALPSDGRVTALDVTEDFLKKTNTKDIWKEAGVLEKIDLKIGPAISSLESLIANGEAGTYDFAFIDADKSSYMDYYELCLKLLRPNGIVAVDNMLWHGAVIDQNVTDADTVALREMANKIATDNRVESVLIELADGVSFCLKK